ncbi:aldehyde dehydrogenase family protein [Bordetella bronchiseptica]|uniref:aldehyde dehydrogenase family protein n=6 Tax=Bordetella bronchiseptica TaxID=518 RepID=UPI0004A195D4|nr:aldehyde dehydrogenase family protein [Bordetella bronchiseptica]KDB66779.1 aldehyde dehydrogenase (NAD) family protein [Bordetella bronchiseptica A1-7]KDB69538.1 aldehyde dehydrogenase (NAD) family protein [Bordetella bronchiseptica B20-10725633]VEF45280.1 Putative aldehyde dehydrogenase SA1924 [Bordetella bronchiseptica]VTQ93814.1 Putative aldehyde dehydrogenase SA1924 [Bordetella bronchiseptica]
MDYAEFYADGAFHPCGGAAVLPVYNPATEQAEASVRACSADDLERAVRAAAAAGPGWGAAPPAQRRDALDRLAEALRQRAPDIVAGLAREIGCPVWLGELMQVPMAMKGMAHARDGMDAIAWRERIGNGLVERVPVGVIAAITPWNFPLHQIVAKVAAALAAGCTVVLKPSELAPGAAWQFIQACHDAALPPGVVNLVWGDAAIGQALVAHEAVDQVSFTGSTEVGRSIMAEAGRHLKRTTLELGGKSAAVLLPDAELERALPVVLRMAVANSGQACVSQSRLIVPRQRLAEAEQALAALAQAWPQGDPLDAATRLGPLANARQFERVNAMVSRALQQGARLVAGGPGRLAGQARGWHVPVTILSDVTPDMELAQEEVFGPVLALMPYEDGGQDGGEGQALALANATRYGLSGAVWSADAARAAAFARRMKTGQVIINGADQNLATPFGGRGASGVGRENGRFGIEECLTWQSLHGAP